MPQHQIHLIYLLYLSDLDFIDVLVEVLVFSPVQIMVVVVSNRAMLVSISFNLVIVVMTVPCSVDTTEEVHLW